MCTHCNNYNSHTYIGESGTSKGDSVAVPTSTTQESPRLSVHRESTAPVKPRSGFTIPSALKLINMNKGREISARAHSAPKNGFSAFVLLRHLHTRDLMRKVGFWCACMCACTCLMHAFVHECMCVCV